MTLEEIIRYHALKYPLSEPRDAVKLIYQNEFGGGHLISDPARSLAYLEAEYETTAPDRSPTAVISEPIGNGIVRVNIAALDRVRMPPVRLNDIFVRSAAAIHGTPAGFRDKLAILTSLTDEGIFAFGVDGLYEYLVSYLAVCNDVSCPPVSHSEAYRAAYAPAYRVVLEELYKTENES